MKKTPIFLILASLIILTSLSFFYSVSSNEDLISEINNNLKNIESISSINNSEEVYFILNSLTSILEGQENLLALGNEELDVNNLREINEYTITIMNSILNEKEPINVLLIEAVNGGQIAQEEMDSVLFSAGLVLEKTEKITGKISEIENPEEGESAGDASSEDLISEINNNLKYIESITRINSEAISIILNSLAQILEDQQSLLNLENEQLNPDSLLVVNEDTITVMNSILNKDGSLRIMLIEAVNSKLITQSQLDSVLSSSQFVFDKTKEITSKISEIENPEEGEPEEGEPDGDGGIPPEPEFTCSTNVSGYAWSPNIGWINMCGVEYDLSNIQQNGGIPLIGAAWSPNVGWIIFDPNYEGPKNYPIPQSLKHGPQIDLLNGQISGWAKTWSMETDAIQGTNYDKEYTCLPSMAGCSPAPLDWADGWINFSGQATNNDYYGVGCDFNTGECLGHAWGDKVVGWINFGGVQGMKIDPILKPDLTLTLDGGLTSNQVVKGNSVNLNWVGDNLLAGSCNLLEGTTSIASSFSVTSTGGNQNSGPLNNTGTIKYTISCLPDPATTGLSAPIISFVVVTVVEDLCKSWPGAQTVIPQNAIIDPNDPEDCICEVGYTLSPQYVCDKDGGFKFRIPWFIER